jgi:hypothetical protein
MCTLGGSRERSRRETKEKKNKKNKKGRRKEDEDKAVRWKRLV